MNKNVLVISSTLRKNGNSEILALEFLKGAKDNGNNVEFVSLQDKEIKFCKGCLACQKLGECVIKDDSNDIVKKMKNADVIAFATPIYYYELSGQLKTLLDRGNPMYGSDYKFREVYFLATAADTNLHAANIAINSIKGWIECFPNARLKDVVFASGVVAPKDILKTSALENAYKIGKEV